MKQAHFKYAASSAVSFFLWSNVARCVGNGFQPFQCQVMWGSMLESLRTFKSDTWSAVEVSLYLCNEVFFLVYI